jgi:DNA invertase Pin-like site-specific DNA recombinase
MEDAQGHEVAYTLIIGTLAAMTATTTAREYLRVSTDKSGQMRSIEDQHADNVRTAEAEGWALGEPYVENGAVSASRYTRKARPGFEALAADVKRGTFGADVLILWEPSRGSRRLSVWAAFLEALEDRGIRLHITSHGRTYDLSNVRDKRSLHEDGVDSEYESGKLSGRVARAMAANGAAGKPHGRPAYGYRREYMLNAAGKRQLVGQVRDPDTATVVERIFTHLGRAVSLRAIAMALNADAIPAPSGGTWTAQGVRDLALNPAYAGLRLHVAGRRSGHDRTRDGVLVPGQWPAIVPAEKWHAIRATLTDPARRTSRPGRDKHLASMIATCDVCGSALTVRYRRGAPEYSCRGSGHVRVRQDDLDGLVTRLVLARLAQEDEYPHITRKDTTAEVQAARNEVATVTAHHREMIRLMRERKMSPMAFAAAEPGVLEDIAKAEARLRELQTPDALKMLLGDPGQDIKKRWAAATMPARREVVRTLCARLAVGRAPSPGHRADITDRVSIEWRQP